MNPLSLLFLASFQSLIGGDHGDKGAGIGNSNGRIVNLEVDENGFDDNTVGFAPSMLRIKPLMTILLVLRRQCSESKCFFFFGLNKEGVGATIVTHPCARDYRGT